MANNGDDSEDDYLEDEVGSITGYVKKESKPVAIPEPVPSNLSSLSGTGSSSEKGDKKDPSEWDGSLLTDAQKQAIEDFKASAPHLITPVEATSRNSADAKKFRPAGFLRAAAGLPPKHSRWEPSPASDGAKEKPVIIPTAIDKYYNHAPAPGAVTSTRPKVIPPPSKPSFFNKPTPTPAVAAPPPMMAPFMPGMPPMPFPPFPGMPPMPPPGLFYPPTSLDSSSSTEKEKKYDDDIDPDENDLFVKLLLKKLQQVKSKERLARLHVELMTLVQQTLDDLQNASKSKDSSSPSAASLTRHYYMNNT